MKLLVNNLYTWLSVSYLQLNIKGKQKLVWQIGEFKGRGGVGVKMQRFTKLTKGSDFWVELLYCNTCCVFMRSKNTNSSADSFSSCLTIKQSDLNKDDSKWILTSLVLQQTKLLNYVVSINLNIYYGPYTPCYHQ